MASFFKTPLRDDGAMDAVSYRRTAEHLVDVGTRLAIVGMTGSETHSLADVERVLSLEIALEVCGDRVPVCASVAGLSVQDVATAAQRAERMGADMIAVIPPTWSRSESDIVACVKAVAQAVPCALMVHSIGGAGVTLSPGTLAQLPLSEPNVVYFKEEAPHAPRRVARLLQVPGGEKYLGIMLSPPLVLGYLAGARLFMGSGDLTEPYRAIFDALEAEDLVEARRVNLHVSAVTFFKRYIGGEFGNKIIMYRRGLFDSPRKASPSVSGGLTAAEEEELTELLRPLLPYYSKYPPKPPA